MAKKQKNMSWLMDDDDWCTQQSVDAHWAELIDGDSVIAIKDLKVRWSADIKRGEVFKNIRLTDDSALIESGKMVLRTEFFKKK